MINYKISDKPIPHPLTDLWKQHQLIIEALVTTNTIKPVQIRIINGNASFVVSELTDYEKSLYLQLQYIQEKINKFQADERKERQYLKERNWFQ
jgi:hypothetical protein